MLCRKKQNKKTGDLWPVLCSPRLQRVGWAVFKSPRLFRPDPTGAHVARMANRTLRLFYGCSYRFHLSGDTVVTVILWTLDRVRERALTRGKHLSPPWTPSGFGGFFLVIEARGGTWFRTPSNCRAKPSQHRANHTLRFVLRLFLYVSPVRLSCTAIPVLVYTVVYGGLVSRIPKIAVDSHQ